MKLPKTITESKDISVGIIGGADGPTAVFIDDADDKDDNHSKWQQVLDVCKKQTVPKERKVTGDELKKYLIEQYGAIEMEISEGKKSAIKISVLSNYYPEALLQSPMPPINVNKETWLEWAKKNHANCWEAAQKVPDEEYGLSYVCLTIPRTEKTECFYETMEQKYDNRREHQSLLSKIFRKSSQQLNVSTEEMEFLIELSTGYMQLNNGCKSLMNKIILWRGVTKEDIENQTTVFQGYAAAMRDEGNLQL